MLLQRVLTRPHIYSPSEQSTPERPGAQKGISRDGTILSQDLFFIFLGHLTSLPSLFPIASLSKYYYCTTVKQPFVGWKTLSSPLLCTRAYGGVYVMAAAGETAIREGGAPDWSKGCFTVVQ